MAGTTILVVDDEPQIRRVLRATLSSSGYDVIEAKNGQEAVEMVIREQPALILMDVNMPVMSGLEACSKIRLSFPGPIIMVTVRNSERDSGRARPARPSQSQRIRGAAISRHSTRPTSYAQKTAADHLGTDHGEETENLRVVITSCGRRSKRIQLDRAIS